jgi:transcriptional regulator with XRE-family HTH domain
MFIALPGHLCEHCWKGVTYNPKTRRPVMAHFGERLRLLRGKRSQKLVAEELRMRPTTLSTLENQENLPRGDVLERLARHFAVPVSYFFPEPVKPSEAASNHLASIRGTGSKTETIATYSTLDLDHEKQQMILSVIRQKHAETSHNK